MKRDDDMDVYWEEGFLGQGEWNDHEHHGKEGVSRECKKTIFREDGLEVL